MAPYSPIPIDVAAGLVFREGRLLITQRRAMDHLGGLWEFPGGKLESGESFQDCLHRELHEELGIEVQILECVEEVTHAYPEKLVRIRFFRCTWRRNEPQALGCHALTWVTSETLADFAFPPADERLLHLLAQRPHLWIP